MFRKNEMHLQFQIISQQVVVEENDLFILHTMATDGLATQGARTSAAIFLHQKD